MKKPNTQTLRCWMNYCRAQYQLARDALRQANQQKAPRGEIMRRLNHWRSQTLTTALSLRLALLARRGAR